MNLTERLAVLEQVRHLGEGVLSPEQLDEASALQQRASTRRALSPDHTTVGLFGATGSGKSSVFNALAGHEVARAGVTRPTTSQPSAALWHDEGSAPLLDWLQVREAWVADDPGPVPLVLLDLPDFDSIATENRLVAERLAGQVDVLVWVVDPQKYADRVIHRDYLRPLAHQQSVTLVVLNQIDRLPEREVPRVVRSLQGLLAEDGLTDARVFPVSARTGVGIDALRSAIQDIAQRKTASDERLSADVAAWARGVTENFGTVGSLGSGPEKALLRQVSAAARIDTISQAVGAAYRKRSHQATGWVLTSWISRLRPDPLRRLRVEPDSGEPLAHTSLPPMSGRERALLSTGVREYTAKVAATLPEQWRGAVLDQGREAVGTLERELDREIGSIQYHVKRSWWWPIATLLQWMTLLIALVGVGWYLAAWASISLGLPLIQISKIEGWPVPGMLVVFGLLLGILLGVVFAAIGRIVAAGKARRARALLGTGTDRAVKRVVIDPLGEETGRASELLRLLARLARG